MRPYLFLPTLLLAFTSPADSQASQAECWVAGNFIGQSAQADRGYLFQPDTFRDGMLICFTGETGTVSGNDIPLVRLGHSTLLGASINDRGLEVVNVYQIDRANSKLLFTQTRIGTASVTSLRPDYAATFGADVVKE
jgi:hypothetical protein